MGNKVVDRILNAVEKFLSRIVIIKRGYEENLQGRGFHTIRFYSFLETFVVLGNDSEENKKKISQVEKRLITECKRQVTNDRDKAKENMVQKKKD